MLQFIDLPCRSDTIAWGHAVPVSHHHPLCYDYKQDNRAVADPQSAFRTLVGRMVWCCGIDSSRPEQVGQQPVGRGCPSALLPRCRRQSE